MTPHQFLTRLRQEAPAAAYLFAGPEPYQREFCRKALLERVLPEAGDRENGFVRHDLQETSLSAVIDDACSLSLFAPQRLIWVWNAEAALPRGKAAVEESEEAAPASSDAAALGKYLKNPVPGVVLVFEAARYELEGEDKKKLERVRKFYAAVPVQVEFAPMSVSQARQFAEKLARRAGLEIGGSELDLLVEALGADAARIATELDKLRLYAGPDKAVSASDISELVPDARATTIFALVDALGRNDRLSSLEVLDTLVRQSEYLPLALSFLSTQFRYALAAKEAGLRSAQQVQAHFQGLGVPMWPSRAEQIYRTVSTFSKPQIAAAIQRIFSADWALRDARPDDRVVMENFILRLTGA
jgi:DNA polymerase-3 subunit delta